MLTPLSLPWPTELAHALIVSLWPRWPSWASQSVYMKYWKWVGRCRRVTRPTFTKGWCFSFVIKMVSLVAAERRICLAFKPRLDWFTRISFKLFFATSFINVFVLQKWPNGEIPNFQRNTTRAYDTMTELGFRVLSAVAIGLQLVRKSRWHSKRLHGLKSINGNV